METSDRAMRPGDVVRQMMTVRGWSQAELAFVLGIAPTAVNQLVNSKRPITAEMAKALSLAFGEPAVLFADIQMRWSLASAAEPDESITERAHAQSTYPLREMVKRGWIDDPANGAAAYPALCRFFDVNSLDDEPRLVHAARRTEGSSANGSQLAWLYRVRAIAREMPTPRYSPESLRKAISQMSLMREAPEETRHVARLLHEAGVRFVVVEGLPGGRIDGVCFWLDSSSPVIGMSLRFDRIDNFWFVLRHECAHVLHEHGKASAIIDTDVGTVTSAEDNEEVIANREAADFCVPDEKIQSFYLRKKPFFSDMDIQAFAKINRVHPGLVVGQLHRMLGEFRLLRQHLASIRKFVTSSAMTDGWGDIINVS